MNRENLISIGHYYDWDIGAMSADFSVSKLSQADEIFALPKDLRSEVQAIAFKGHNAFDGSHMDAIPNLGLIANYGVGYDAIDVSAALARGIRVTNTPDVLNDDVADLAVAMMLAQSREMVVASDWVRSGNWAEKGDLRLARKVSGRRAGIVGLGRIGREIANRLVAFNMDIHYHSRAPKQTPGNWTYHADPIELAKAVDYLFVALVGGAETQSYVSRSVLEALGHDGIIINISRGSTIDEAAMLDALEKGEIRGAALDVFLGEPKINPRFLALENVLLLPHIGSASVETRKAMGQLQRDNLAAYFAGKPLLTPVN